VSENNLLEKTISAIFKAALGENKTGLNPDGSTKPGMVYKQFQEDEQLVLGVVLQPEVEDLHKDIYSAEEIAKAAKSFDEHCNQGNLEHMINTDDLEVTKSFILPVDAVIGEQEVSEGSWVMEMKVHSEDLWQSVKDGNFTGFSVGCGAYHEDLE
jgi:hypothetical protein